MRPMIGAAAPAAEIIQAGYVIHMDSGLNTVIETQNYSPPEPQRRY
jgi:hypothetical protein